MAATAMMQRWHSAKAMTDGGGEREKRQQRSAMEAEIEPREKREMVGLANRGESGGQERRGRSQGRQRGGIGNRQRQRADGDTGAWRDHGGKEKGSHGVGSQNSRKIALVQPPRTAVAGPTVKMRRGRRQTKAMGANGEAVKEGRGHGGGRRRHWVLVAEVERGEAGGV